MNPHPSPSPLQKSNRSNLFYVITMDIVGFFFLILGYIALGVILIIGVSLVVEVKKTRTEIVKFIHLMNQMNTTLIHQTSKFEIMDRQLRIIGSKLVPEKYRRKSESS